MPLVKWSQTHIREPLVLVVSNGFNAVEVYTDPFVRVSEGDVGREVIVKRVVGGVEIEPRECGICDMEFHLFGTENKPENEDCKEA